MKINGLLEKINNNFITEEKEQDLVSLFDSRINAKKKINMYVSFTFITPNYRAINILHTISKLLKVYPMARVHVILSDANMFNQEYVKSVGLQFETDYSKFIKKQVDKIYSYLVSFGAKPNQVHVHTFSELWQRAINNKKHHFIINYYSVISKIKLDSKFAKTFDRLFQFSSDIFFSVILNYLFPEITDGIDIFFGRYEKKEIYEKVRATLYKEGVSKIKKPYLIFFKPHPELMYNQRIPEWNMSYEEILYIVENKDLSKEDAKNMLYLYEPDIGQIELILDGRIIKKTFNECIIMLDSEKKHRLSEIVASAIYQFLQERKCEIDEDISNPQLDISKKEDVVNITRILKTKNILEILEICETEQTTSAISKKLNIQTSNVSKYLNELKEVGLIKIKEGKYIRTHNKILIKLDN